MRYFALACDYDGTIADHGEVHEATIAALTRVRTSGRKLILVTGRQLDDLIRVFPRLDLFHSVVVENGAVLYRPDTGEEKVLAPPPPPELAERLAAQGVAPLSVGRVIVATWEPHEVTVLETIRALGLELQVIFNKGAVMVLPSGVNKATGLAAALAELGLSLHDVVGVGDAENDHAMLSQCELGVALANAIPTLKEHADWVTQGARGAGVRELIEELLADDLAPLDERSPRHHVTLGLDERGVPVAVPLLRHSVLLTGASGGGKSTWATGIIERISEQGYQVVVVDPEGDYGGLTAIPTIGDEKTAPAVTEIEKILAEPGRSVCVLIQAVPLADRPRYFAELMHVLLGMRTRVGRPHVFVVDEAHHVLPSSPGPESVPARIEGTLYITMDPTHMAAPTVRSIDLAISIGDSSDEAELLRHGRPALPLRLVRGRTERLRHRRKYAHGTLGEDNSFYFRGPDDKLNLRAQNLTMFSQILDGIDADTFLHHLHAGDYSRWMRRAIKDDDLAAEVAAVEAAPAGDPREAARRIRDAIEKRYTAPA